MLPTIARRVGEDAIERIDCFRADYAIIGVAALSRFRGICRFGEIDMLIAKKRRATPFVALARTGRRYVSEGPAESWGTKGDMILKCLHS